MKGGEGVEKRGSDGKDEGKNKGIERGGTRTKRRERKGKGN